ncbi:MAG: hypothetical protein M1469_01000 [Bacteroidetes bacterium]|nr:hypothetical protein [Bacteroidota bacterium]
MRQEARSRMSEAESERSEARRRMQEAGYKKNENRIHDKGPKYYKTTMSLLKHRTPDREPRTCEGIFITQRHDCSLRSTISCSHRAAIVSSASSASGGFLGWESLMRP